MAIRSVFTIHCLLIVPLLIYSSSGQFINSETDLKKTRDITYPTRVDKNGDTISEHFITKRSTKYVENFDEKVSYMLHAFGRRFLLDLTYTKDFIAPSFVVQHLSGNYTWLNNSHKDIGLNQCFYTGRINNESSSRAVFNLCEGMMGVFHFLGERYLVEPCLQEEIHIHPASFSKSHYIYRYLPVDKNKTEESHCEVQENYKHTRRKNEEEHRHLQEEFSSFSNSKPHLVHSQSHRDQNNVNSDLHHVHKRSTSYKRHVEVMVAADNKMLRYHGADLERYILTLMAIVASIYRDPSIGNFINVVVVKIVVFRSEQDGPRITSNAAASLTDFCKWQHIHNMADDRDPHHYDTAVLLTRQDICRAPQKCDTLGLAELGTMCDSLRSCSIIEDNGISAAYTVAHELGHVFSLPHDDNKRCVDYLSGKVTDHVMSPTLDHNTSPWTWSKCSSVLLTKFIDAGSAECLLDRPSTRKFSRKTSRTQTRAPGELYDVNKQCSLMFGPDFRVCPYMMDCKRLWCTDSKNKAKGCRTLHMPWTDGTHCGPNKWCRRGKCISKISLEPLDGQWGKWEDYGQCTRTCGGGIKKGIRRCNNPVPVNGGKYCIGRRTRYRSCNTKPCPPGTKDFREVQCSAFNNNLKLQGLSSNVRWVPKYAGIRLKDSCKLYCKESTSAAYYLLKDKVIDGTKCGPDTFDVCVNGKCRKAGCDNRLGSGMKLDKCGICGGDNSTCHTKRISNKFNQLNLTYGYNYVHEIPSGARDLIIRQRGISMLQDDGNYLALKNASGFILNGNSTINVAKTKIKVKGAWIEYSGSGEMIEQINATGPIGENVTVWVLSVGDLYPPNIEYTYYLNIDSTFRWSMGPWSTCDRLCNGKRYRHVVCVSDDKDRITVSDRKCERLRLKKPVPISEQCNTACTLRWSVEKQECSSRCGEGVAIQKVFCVKQTTWREETIEEKECDVLGPRPGDVVTCIGDCKPTRWDYAEWSKCTKTCDGGYQTRHGRCMDYRDNELPDTECEESGKVELRKCNEQPCPYWQTSPWTGCSHTCGGGTRHRKVHCLNDGSKVNENDCKRSDRPPNIETCNTASCPIWYTGGWERCSVTCGHGVSVRNIQCRAVSGKILHAELCDPSSRPYDTRKCYMGPCPTRQIRPLTTVPPPTTTTTTVATTTTVKTTTTPRLIVKWKFSDWSQCSVTCGDGRRNRFVRCEDVNGIARQDFLCSHLKRPISTEPCSEKPCGYWRSGPWGECSTTCGEGETIRQVACFYYDHTRAGDEQCNYNIRPETTRKCNFAECPGSRKSNQGEIARKITTSQWRVGPWTKCSVACGSGWQRRLVLCQDNGKVSSDCDRNRKPPEIRACNPGPCPSWKTHLWSACSVTCDGDGFQDRRVLCQLPNGQIMPDNLCNETERPEDRRACNKGPCQSRRRWLVDPWSPCSVTCGRGHQQREVTCVSDDGSPKPLDECPGSKPRVIKRCHMGRCPRWFTEDWSRCSVTCGEGIRSRQIKCKSKNYKTIGLSYCNAKKKPRTQKTCTRRPCSDYSWRKGSWSQCSKTCGFGIKYRTITCTNRQGQEVAESFCSDKKPKMHRRCSEFPCPYIWNTSPWSKCNATCGTGLQTRIVVCQAVTKEGWILPGEVPYGCNREGKPPTARTCNFGDCGSAYHWVVGSWGKCSSRCGWGKERRLVMCVDVLGRRRSKKRCPKELKPTPQQPCYNGPCYAKSCTDLKMKTKIRHDDVYSLLVKGRILPIYCKNMRRSKSQEYITLPTGVSENYAEIYDRKLRRPNTCPENGTRMEDCPLCRETRYKESGITSFTKLRIDLSSLRIITNDFTYSTTYGDNHIPFGTAGDCYSSQGHCPQGRFSINLAGTGLIMSKNTTWTSIGKETSKKIEILQDGEIVRGLCGGYCGICSPSVFTGLQLDTRH